MRRHYNCKERRPSTPSLPPSHLQAFGLLKLLSELEPGERMPISALERKYGNPCDVVRKLRCQFGWNIETREKDSLAETRATEGFYILTAEHHALAREMFAAYYARKGGKA